MTTYTGPVPPPPGGQADAPTWANWINFQTLLQNLRYEDERAARAVVLDRQHAEKMAAEAACAAANKALADAQKALAVAQQAAADAVLRIHAVPPAPSPVPGAPGLVAETVAIAKRWQQQYAAPGALPAPTPMPPDPNPLPPQN